MGPPKKDNLETDQALVELVTTTVKQVFEQYHALNEQVQTLLPASQAQTRAVQELTNAVTKILENLDEIPHMPEILEQIKLHLRPYEHVPQSAQDLLARLDELKTLLAGEDGLRNRLAKAAEGTTQAVEKSKLEILHGISNWKVILIIATGAGLTLGAILGKVDENLVKLLKHLLGMP